LKIFPPPLEYLLNFFPFFCGEVKVPFIEVGQKSNKWEISAQQRKPNNSRLRKFLMGNLRSLPVVKKKPKVLLEEESYQ
jgi:hypothetical protein